MCGARCQFPRTGEGLGGWGGVGGLGGGGKQSKLTLTGLKILHKFGS